MKSAKPYLSMTVAFAVLTATSLAQQAQARERIVPLEELHGALQASTQDRTKNIADIERVLSYPAAEHALERANVNRDQMRAAVATLSSAELARLAAQARTSEHEVQAGLIRGILALIGLITVIVIVIVLIADAEPYPAENHAIAG